MQQGERLDPRLSGEDVRAGAGRRQAAGVDAMVTAADDGTYTQERAGKDGVRVVPR